MNFCNINKSCCQLFTLGSTEQVRNFLFSFLRVCPIVYNIIRLLGRIYHFSLLICYPCSLQKNYARLLLYVQRYESQGRKWGSRFYRFPRGKKEEQQELRKSGYKHEREKIGQNSRSIMQEFAEIIPLQVSTMAWYISLKFLIVALHIYVARSRQKIFCFQLFIGDD